MKTLSVQQLETRLLLLKLQIHDPMDAYFVTLRIMNIRNHIVRRKYACRVIRGYLIHLN